MSHSPSRFISPAGSRSVKADRRCGIAQLHGAGSTVSFSPDGKTKGMLHGLSQWKMRSVHLWGVFPGRLQSIKQPGKTANSTFFLSFFFIAHSTQTWCLFTLNDSWALGYSPFPPPSNFDLELILWSKSPRGALKVCLGVKSCMWEEGLWRRGAWDRFECSCSPADSVHGAEARMRFVRAAGGGGRGAGSFSAALAPCATEDAEAAGRAESKHHNGRWQWLVASLWINVR